MNISQAYNKAFDDIMSKGYNTLAYARFLHGCYCGVVVLQKKATWKSKPRATFRVYKKGVVGKSGHPILLTKDAKEDFMKRFVKGIL